MGVLEQVFWLFAFHFVADFQFQTDYLAKTKIPKNSPTWVWSMTAHSALHAIGVAIILGPLLGILEWIAHWVTDYSKARGHLGTGSVSFAIDQFLHIGTKLVWIAISIFFM